MGIILLNEAFVSYLLLCDGIRIREYYTVALVKFGRYTYTYGSQFHECD